MSALPASPVSRKPWTSKDWAHPARLVLGVVFLLLMILTKPVAIGGDTYWFVLDIKATLGRRWTDSSRLWDFAHVLWRPLGKMVSQLFLPVVSPHFDGDPQRSITFLLVCLSVISALVCCFVVHAAVWRMTGKPWVATLVACAFLCLNPILNYSRTGTPYLCGLACSTGAFYLAAFCSKASSRQAVFSGVLAGLAVLFWVPNLVSLPAVLLARPILDIFGEKPRINLRFAMVIGLVAGITVAAFYLTAIAAAHISSWSGFLAWIHSSAQYSRDRNLLRMATGMARGFYQLGNDAVWFKWFVFRDPYANVGLADLMRAVLVKLVLFYVSLASLAVVLWTSNTGRRLLLFIALAALPHIGMAMVFESGDPGRYVGTLPAVCLGFGYAIGSAEFSGRMRILVAALFCAHVPLNLLPADANQATLENANRIAAFAALQPVSRVYLLNFQDGLQALRYAAPFDPVNRRPTAEIVLIAPAITARAPFWRADFACSALAAWSNRGEVWVTKRVLSDRPVRSWWWVEGDHPPLTWEGMHRFFQGLDRGADAGGEDGFFLIPDAAGNRRILLAGIPGGDPKNCPAPATVSLQAPDAPVKGQGN
jgi:hypothetical protein